MRLNRYIAMHTSYSRRQADQLIEQGKVRVNGQIAEAGQNTDAEDVVTIDGKKIDASSPKIITIMLNKPAGYVCSRQGQGNPTIYDLLPAELQHLNYVGRLDKDSSGLLLMTNDGELVNRLTHPRYRKVKVYEISLDKPMAPQHQQMISDQGIMLDDGLSRLQIEKMDKKGGRLRIAMHEGRNRQIRRTFAAFGYEVEKLHRIQLGDHKLGSLGSGKLQFISSL